LVVITVDIAAWHDGGEVGHSPEHHVSDKTGLHDVVWDEINGCTEGGGGDPTST
jgi:hypothetical protein